MIFVFLPYCDLHHFDLLDVFTFLVHLTVITQLLMYIIYIKSSWHRSCHMYNISSIKESQWHQSLSKYWKIYKALIWYNSMTIYTFEPNLYLITLEKTDRAMKNGHSTFKRYRLKANKTKHRAQKTKEMSNTDHSKNRGWIEVLTKSKQFLLLIRYLQCYSYIQSSESLGSDRGKKKYTLNVKDPLSFEIWSNRHFTITQ